MLEEKTHNLHNLQSAVYVPFLQSAATGLFIAVAVCGLAVLLHWRLTVALLAAAGLGASVTWVYLLTHWLRLTSPPPPVVVNDYIDTPQTEMPCIRVEVKEDRRLTFIDMPCDPDQLARLAAGVLDGAPLSESAWTGRGRPFSKSQFIEVRQTLLTRGLAVWKSEKSPAQGIQLTAAGRALFRHCVTTPLLLEDRTQD